MRGAFFAVVAALATVGLPEAARADGMSFPKRTHAGMDVRATEQRAIMWLRSGTWEIHIQPRFSRETGEAAWVVPFPVRPQIHEGSADFFDQIEVLTAPVFIHYCWPEEDTGGCGGGGTAEMGGDGVGGRATTVEDGETDVVVWERGEVGDLEYSVLSATDGDSLVGWLDAEEFDVSAGAGELLADLETEGRFFFVSRLDETADPEKPVSPVRFVLPGMEEPTYPLELTALGAPEGETLDLTIWVVFPDDRTFVPDSHPYEVFDESPRSVNQYRMAVEDLFDENDRETVLLLSEVPGWTMRYAMSMNAVCDEDAYWEGSTSLCFNLPNPPEAWVPELGEIGEGGDSEEEGGNTVFRFQARLDAEAMATDLVFADTDAIIDAHSNVYAFTTGDGTCRESDVGACSLLGRPAPGSRVPLAIAVGVLAIAVLCLVRPRTRRLRRRDS